MEDPNVESITVSSKVLFRNAKKVTYCGICKFPPEYCEFSSLKKCAPWLLKNCPDMYPNLEEIIKPKPKKTPKQIQGSFFPWVEIKQLHNIISNIKTENTQNQEKIEKISYKGKIKLHGTNAGVTIQKNGTVVLPQSRNKFLTKRTDHHGFFGWLKKNENYFKNLWDFHKNNNKELNFENINSFTIFGEFCGKGIMKGAAICEISETIFAIFAIQFDKLNLILDPILIQNFLKPNEDFVVPEMIKIIPYITESFNFDFSDETNLSETVDEINNLVEKIEKEDPWVKETFDVSGVGEGIVWYPVSFENENGLILFEKYSKTVFKTKGQSHSVLNSEKSAKISPEKLDSVQSFVSLFVSEGRCQQGVSEANSGKMSSKAIKFFVNWMVKDIQKESKDELEFNNIEWNDVLNPIKEQSRRWYFAQLNKNGLNLTDNQNTESDVKQN